MPYYQPAFIIGDTPISSLGIEGFNWSWAENFNIKVDGYSETGRVLISIAIKEPKVNSF